MRRLRTVRARPARPGAPRAAPTRPGRPGAARAAAAVRPARRTSRRAATVARTVPPPPPAAPNRPSSQTPMPPNRPKRTPSRSRSHSRSRLALLDPRFQVVHANRLAGPSGVNATGSPLDRHPLPWPEAIRAAFAISMRTMRWKGMQARLGSWSDRVQLWSATNGSLIHLDQYKSTGRLHPSATLRRGEIGCYDSHMRLWERIVQQHIPLTLILEDDANLRHTQHHADAIKRALEEANRVPGGWNLLYLGHNERFSGFVQGCLVKPTGCQGLFGYLLTEEGAKICLQHARPMRLPVDVMVSNLHDRGLLKAVALHPRLFYVVPVHSDTAHIN